MDQMDYQMDTRSHEARQSHNSSRSQCPYQPSFDASNLSISHDPRFDLPIPRQFPMLNQPQAPPASWDNVLPHNHEMLNPGYSQMFSQNQQYGRPPDLSALDSFMGSDGFDDRHTSRSLLHARQSRINDSISAAPRNDSLPVGTVNGPGEIHIEGTNLSAHSALPEPPSYEDMLRTGNASMITTRTNGMATAAVANINVLPLPNSGYTPGLYVQHHIPFYHQQMQFSAVQSDSPGSQSKCNKQESISYIPWLSSLHT